MEKQILLFIQSHITLHKYLYSAILIFIFHQNVKVLFLPVYPFLRVLDPKKCQNQPSDDFHSLSAIVWHPCFLNAAKDIRSIDNIQRENVRGINWVSYKVFRLHLDTMKLFVIMHLWIILHEENCFECSKLYIRMLQFFDSLLQICGSLSLRLLSRCKMVVEPLNAYHVISFTVIIWYCVVMKNRRFKFSGKIKINIYTLYTIIWNFYLTKLHVIEVLYVNHD